VKIFFNVMKQLRTDLAEFVRLSFTGEIYKTWSTFSSLRDVTPGLFTTLKGKGGTTRNWPLRKGNATCFLGGTASLLKAFAKTYPQFTLEAENKGGIGAVAAFNVKLSKNKVGNFFKSLGGGTDRPERGKLQPDGINEKELFELKSKTLTCICVYNTNTNGHAPPQGECFGGWITPTISLGELATWFAERLKARKVKEGEDMLDRLDYMGLR